MFYRLVWFDFQKYQFEFQENDDIMILIGADQTDPSDTEVFDLRLFDHLFQTDYFIEFVL